MVNTICIISTSWVDKALSFSCLQLNTTPTWYTICMRWVILAIPPTQTKQKAFPTWLHPLSDLWFVQLGHGFPSQCFHSSMEDRGYTKNTIHTYIYRGYNFIAWDRTTIIYWELLPEHAVTQHCTRSMHHFTHTIDWKINTTQLFSSMRGLVSPTQFSLLYLQYKWFFLAGVGGGWEDLLWGSFKNSTIFYIFVFFL